MELPQFYATTILDDETDLGLEVTFVPRRVLSNFPLGNAVEAMKALGLEPHCTIAQPRLAHALTAILTISGKNDSRIDNLNALVVEESAAFRFAQAVVSEIQVPFESSPLKGETLAQATSGAMVGAALGFYLSGGNPLLLGILVPTGMFICGPVMEFATKFGKAAGEEAGKSFGQALGARLKKSFKRK